MIRAIIFDCFGVLTTDGWIAFKKRHFRDKRQLLEKATELNNIAGSGAISYGDFLSKVGVLAGITADEAQHEIESNISDDELFDYISSLKPKYKIGMLSNAAANHLQQLFSQEQVAMFDAIVLSYEAAVVKPAEQSYQLIAQRLRVSISECVFVDDQEKHCEGARLAGMKAILYQDFNQMEAELEATLKN